MTIPSPSVLHFRQGYAAIKGVYPDIDAYFDDLARAYQKAIRAFYDAGCRYLQLDDVAWAYLCSEEQRAAAHERGDDVSRLPNATPVYQQGTRGQACGHDDDDARLPRELPLHLDFVRRLRARGRNAPADAQPGRLLSQVRHGSRRRLRAAAIPAEGPEIVVLGLVTSKDGTLEKKDDIKRRIDEAARFAPLEQFALSPQCGFASTEEGNVLTEEAQWAKLREIVEIAEEVWSSR